MEGRRGWDRQSTTLTPPLRSSVPIKDAGDLGGMVGVPDWRPQPRVDRGLRVGGPRSIQVWGQPIGDPDPSIEVVGTHGGRRRPWWRGWGCRLAAPTPNRPRTQSSVDSELGLPIGYPDPSFPFNFLYRTKIK
ncbi:hypothetical protein CRG98_038909 [Punica granatum]|uniref:Uncharacterized protein n=1 Tax=Punica granatum TaxID=22663 RepID=A0A2I0I9G3_PUNGR|nr:hypothetical protein CRG98_038909 [Punica granatum]